MRNRLSRISLALILLLCFPPVLGGSDSAKNVADKEAAPRKDLSKEINAILAQPPLDRAHWGIDVVELASGKTIFSLNPEQLFLPASNTKLFTTAAALAIAGPDYRFRDRKSTR